MTASTAVIIDEIAAGTERDLRRMELLNRRESWIRATGRPAPTISYLKLATRPRDRWRNQDV
ncbi:hypothetical protein AB1046_17290 [Promicromonospora sp. Populi]|uniref:hypothetical protein n=1 Tax=Promicromonospora sp. Populi TaxID=3239420 RepID=UPI0034E2CA02